jgi:hypothetical protein
MRTALWFGLVALMLLVADRSSATTETFCGDDHWYTLAWPEGWEISEDMTVRPKGATEPAIGVTMPMAKTSAITAETVDLDDRLGGLIRLATISGTPTAIRGWEMSHPSLPTRSAVIEEKDGRLYLSVVDARSGRGNVLIVSYYEAGKRSSDALLTFQQILSSFRFDPTLVCGMGRNHEVVEKRITPPAPAPAAPVPAAEEGFPFGRALGGCGMLQKLFLSVGCEKMREAGRPVAVVEFEDGREPASTYLNRHRERVTSVWCWVASGHTDAPALLFGIKGEDSLREYSCGSGSWGRTVHADQLTWR